MPRMARLVVPGFAHHVTQRGARRQQTFFEDSDFEAYLQLLRAKLKKVDVRIWAYCLMPNHIHAIAVPADSCAMSRLFGDVHRAYAQMINAKHDWKGHLWQERFYSTVMDEKHTYAAMRYVELNPVRAGLCKRPNGWRWSSVHAHFGSNDDDVVDTDSTDQLVTNWRDYLTESESTATRDSIRSHTRSGRPIGDADFVEMIEVITGRSICSRRSGRRLE